MLESAGAAPQKIQATLAKLTFRDVLISISLANLCLLRSWAEVPPYLDSQDAQLLRFWPGLTFCMALLINITIRAAIFSSLMYAGRRIPGFIPWLKRGFILLLLFLLNTFANYGLSRERVEIIQRVLGKGLPVILLIGAIGFIYLMIRLPNWFFRAASLTLLVVSPLALVTGATILSMKPGPSDLNSLSKNHRSSSSSNGLRVIWILVDEWDNRLTYSYRWDDISLPALDAFRDQAIVFNDAQPSANETKLCIPTILTGQNVTGIKIDGNDAELTLDDGKRTLNFSTIPNIFSKLAAKGFSSSVIGWYLPYCRLIGQWTQDCEWWEASFIGTPRSMSFSRQMLLQARLFFETRNHSPFGQPAKFQGYMETHQAMTQKLMHAAIDANLDLVFAHVPYMHRPFFYNRESNKFDLKGNPISGYWDSMVLWDRILGQLIQTIESSPVSARTAIVLTADHSLRISGLLDGRKDPRVPLMIRTPSKNHFQINQKYKTKNLGNIINSLLTEGSLGEVESEKISIGDAENGGPL